MCVVYYDVCGPFQTKTLGGNMYFLLLIDDLTRKCWTYLLSKKSEVLQVAIKFKNLMERQIEKILKF